ncbi:hypothetical protein C2G38_2030572 [Gigaspora rosea]|uniref:SWIM-type domain-containing protein n=1 Tax=Gigaspora rosea TaxID=44941 RepID=A0A397VYF1_9GLOM|nr:hypothetical protein C2G38_2030572 [Gigaspora rosea]
MLQAIIDEVGCEDIREIWKITNLRSEKKHHTHFVAIVNQISFLCSCLMNISKGIICRHYFCVMMHSMIAAFHMSMIPVRWYKDSYQDQTTSMDNIVFNHEKRMLDAGPCSKIILPLCKMATMPTTTTPPAVKKTIHKRNQYGRIWRLAREATLLAVEDGDDEIAQILTKYINMKKNKSKQVTQPNQRALQPTNPQEVFVIIEQNFLANQEQSRITNPTCELSTSNQNIEEESEDELYLSEIEEIEEIKTIMTDSNTLNLADIQNPLHVVGKGRPSNRRYVSSVEKEQKRGGASIRKSYKCRICGQLGHNAAFHKKRNRP